MNQAELEKMKKQIEAFVKSFQDIKGKHEKALADFETSTRQKTEEVKKILGTIKWWEIIFKEPVKVFTSSPNQQLDIQRIRTRIINVASKEKTRPRLIANPEDLFNADWAIIKPKLVFAAQHTDWIDFERSAIQMSEIYVPIRNIAAIL